jgi:hypothetical protein
MHLLALPEDEQEIIRHLCEEEGLQLLLSDLLQEGSPRVAADPLAALVPNLPSRKRLLAAVHSGAPVSDPARQQVWQYLLWARSLGPIRTLADAPAAQDAVDRVALQLNREATEQWRDLIDLSRTPVIGLRRTGWHHREDCLIAGGLTTMRMRTRDLPQDVASLHSRVERRLKRHSQRLDPFETCQVYRGRRLDPRQTRGWWMWAMPHAQAWLAAGGQAFVIDFL